MFAAVFFVVWFGAAVVTLNAQLLGGTMYVHTVSRLSLLSVLSVDPCLASPLFSSDNNSPPPTHTSGNSSFFQSLCILGYCVFPLDIAALTNLLIGLAFKSVILKSIIVAIGFAWATRGTHARPLTYMRRNKRPHRIP